MKTDKQKYMEQASKLNESFYVCSVSLSNRDFLDVF